MDQRTSPLAFRKGAVPGSWRVESQGAIAGTVYRRETVLSNLGKTKQALNSRGVLWEVTTEGAPLTEDDAQAVQGHLSRQKTTRHTAGEYLITAYRAAGVALPDREPSGS